MGSNAQQVKWFVADITEFNPPEKFDLWHDRAVFHFLTNQADIEKYVQTVENNIARNGYLVIGTFSNNGPDICSGLRIEQYSEKKIKPIFESGFRFINYFTENHQTPSGSQQNFLFTIFQKK